MKTKACVRCTHATAVAYRVQPSAAEGWLFVCPSCLPAEQGKPGYRYGGTWKGARH